MITRIAAALAVTMLTADAEDGKFLNVAILRLPERYLADVPLENRARLLTRISEDNDTRHLDYANGWVHWFTDSESVGGTSQFWLKLLPRKNERPLVFVHMAKPFADGSDPQKDQTFVLERRGNEWLDVTGNVIPEQVDLTMHFRPSRSKNMIEVAAYERFKRRDGRGEAYRFGERKLDLVWSEGSFEVRKPTAPQLSELSE
jgi:hypothetical protein